MFKARAAIFNRSENCTRKPRSFKQRFDQICRGGFPVCSSDSDCVKLRGRIPKKIRGQFCQRSTVVRDLNPGGVPSSWLRRSGNDGGGAVGNCLCGEPVAVSS